MTRWHLPYCMSPDVVVDASNNPTCRSCARVCPPVAQLVASLNTASSGIKLPPNEPRGQMNLWWPRDVLYVNQQSPIRSPAASIDESMSKLAIDNGKSTNPHIYEASLKSNEFRLACLTAVPSKEYPVHLTLETFAYDSRPEYETVSYMWGGDNGNSSPCRPIFIGPYWDVLLQSQNCWAMLRFVRPWRGTRMMWIDALCIDQSNLPERAAQVARMRQIYGDSSRVIVFLGEEVTVATTTFPAYVDLDEINTSPSYGVPISMPRSLAGQETPLTKSAERDGPQYNLSKLLLRPYFSRVWVIQELIASDRVLIRVGNVDFRASSAIIHRISGRSSIQFKWNQTRAPWLQYLGQKAVSPARVKDIVSLASLTSRCRATDPRDRIFAVVQLLVDPKLRRNLAADYTLSFQHFSIGFFAHSFLVARNYSFLDYAGLANAASLPSWVPECIVHTAWERALSNALRRDYNLLAYSIFPISDCQVYLDRRSVITCRELISVYDYQPEYIQPAVDAATGALLLDLTHLFAFEHKPVLLGSYGNLYIYQAPNQRADASHKPLCFFAWTRLNVEIGDHLFALPMNESGQNQVGWDDPYTHTNRYDRTRYGDNGLMYFVLRQLPTEQGLMTFQLITTRLALCAQSDRIWPQTGTFIDSDWPALRNFSLLRLSEVQTSVASAITSLLNTLVEIRTVVFSEEQLQHVRGLPWDHETESRIQAAAICKAFHMDFDMTKHDMNRELKGRLDDVIINISFDRAYDKKRRPLIRAIRDFLHRNNVMTLLDVLGAAYHPLLDIDDVVQMIRVGPTTAQKFVGITKYINGVQIDGSILRVLIV